MLLVILGAGASYDSAPSTPPTSALVPAFNYRPPLANELFADRPYFGEMMNKYPQCLPIIRRLRHLSEGTSVELELQKLKDETKQLLDRHKQLAAIRFYLQELLWVCPNQWMHSAHYISNYASLVDDIRCWKQPHQKVCFVTFNYDILLEQALRQADYPFDELSAYIARDLMLIKLHGSVNWARQVITPLGREMLNGNKENLIRHLIEHSAGLQISKRYIVVKETPPFGPDDSGALFPALAIPVETKLDFECPADHVKALESFLPNVTRTLIIGWRAAEKPFLDLLKKHITPGNLHVMVVNGDEENSQYAATKMRQAQIPASHYTALDCGFTDFLRRPESREFLKT